MNLGQLQKTFNSRSLVQIIAGVLAAIVFAVYFSSDFATLRPLVIEHLPNDGLKRQNEMYRDLDGDGRSEAFYITNYEEYDVIEWYDSKFQFQEVIKTHGHLLKSGIPFLFADLDADQSEEMYFFTFRNDSLFIHGIEPMGDDQHFLEDYHLDLDSVLVADEYINQLKEITDLDQDGSAEILIAFISGYGRTPRLLVSFDPQKRRLIRTENSGASYTSMTASMDSALKEMIVITTSNAVENFDPEDSILFNDNSAWVIRYDSSLQNIDFAIEYKENKTHLHAAIIGKHTPNIYVLASELRSHNSYLDKYDLNGRLIKRIQLGTNGRLFTFLNLSYDLPEQIVVSNKQAIYTYDLDLNLIQHKSTNEFVFYGRQQSDKEFYAKTAKVLSIVQDEFRILDRNQDILARKKLEISGLSRFSIVSLVHFISENRFTFSCSLDDRSEIFSVYPNTLYRFRFLIYLIAFIIIQQLFFAIFLLQNKFYNQRLLTQNKIRTLQLQTVQNQLQPHFTFNVLNTIGSMIYKNEKDVAYKYLNHFADMLRSTLLSKNSSDWNLRDELSFVDTYVSMENLRFDGKFDYILKIEEGIDKLMLLPKLTVQAYVENAIRHGLMHKEEDCKLQLSISKDKDHLIVSIEDNGIGREAAKLIQRSHVGVGNEILYEYFEIYNKINTPGFEIEIEDLYQDGNAVGTRVSYKVPLNFESINTLE